jgi:hypothetical protein
MVSLPEAGWRQYGLDPCVADRLVIVHGPDMSRNQRLDAVSEPTGDLPERYTGAATSSRQQS